MRLRALLLLSLGIAASLLPFACSDEPFTATTADAGVDASSATDGGDAQGDALGTQDVVTDGGVPVDEAGCPAGRGAAMIRIGAITDPDTFCIDTKEVTTGEYTAFANAGFDASALPGACSSLKNFNTATGPGCRLPSGYPVTCVTWCDAYAFCAWAGKRLCGSRTGDGPRGAGDNASESAWFAACTGNGTHDYAYGSSYVSGNCNDLVDASTAAAKPVGSMPECVGGYPGLFDMNGNVWEWENACENDAGTALCAIRGGAYTTATPGCRFGASAARENGAADIGIRCCAR